jgi:molecular chaperone HscB
MASSPFDVLGIEPRFSVDLGAIEKRYRELARVVHPDKHTAGGAAERRRAMARAVDLNEAWRTVRDPVRRAEALLRLRGADRAEGQEPKASPELLMEVMELREELGDARAASDVARVRALATSVAEREASLLARLAESFDGAAPPDSILRVLGELRYVRRFLDEARAIEEHLDDAAQG